jgi:hypothetical protein
MARQRAAGSAIVVGGSRPQKRVGRRNEELAFSHASTLVSALQDASWSANESSAVQQSTVVGAVPAGLRNSRTASGKQARCTERTAVVAALHGRQRGDRGPARRAHQHPLKSKAVPSRDTHA